MVRPVNEDPYLSYRFQVLDPTGTNLKIDGGFKTATLPNVTVNAVTYREGTDQWTRKYPGINEVSELSLETGIFRRNSAFFDWIVRIIQGGNREYRSELIVNQFHMQDSFGSKGTPSRVTRLLNCFPTDVKPTGDLSGEDDAVQIETATFACEQIQVELKATTSTPIPLNP